MNEEVKLVRVRVYVGPIAVLHMAAEARAYGATDVIEGTEHVHGTFVIPPGIYDEADFVTRVLYGHSVGGAWRDVEVLSRSTVHGS